LAVRRWSLASAHDPFAAEKLEIFDQALKRVHKTKSFIAALKRLRHPKSNSFPIQATASKFYF
jgi:hypothetical protein